MRVTHTIAASLIGTLLIQSAALAQTTTHLDIRTISREQAVRVLVTNIQIGSLVRVELANGDRVEGRLVDKSDQELAVLSDQQRQIVAVPDIVSVRLPVRSGMTHGEAFGIGTAAGAGVFAGLLFFAFHR